MKSILRKLSIIVITTLSAVLILSFAGCTDPDSKDLQSEFAKYLSLDKKNGIYTMDSETKVSLFSFEKTDDALPKFCIEFNIEDKPLYDWLNLTNEERKSDLKAVAVSAQNFIVSKDYSNRCQIYVSVIYNPGTQSIYDLNKDKLYVPNCDDIFSEMYETYSTYSLSKVREMPSGSDWLATHNIKNSGDLESMWVYVSDGALKISGESKSTAI